MLIQLIFEQAAKIMFLNVNNVDGEFCHLDEGEPAVSSSVCVWAGAAQSA